MSCQQERRGCKRWEAFHLVSFRRLTSTKRKAQWAMGRTLDVSPCGLKIQTSTSLSKGSSLEMILALQEMLIQLRGKVVYVHQVEEHTYDAGIRLEDLSREEMKWVTEPMDHDHGYEEITSKGINTFRENH